MNFTIFFSRPVRCATLLVLSYGAATGAELRIVPTYENASVYVEGTEISPGDLKVAYRPKGEAGWNDGHVLINSAKDTTPRGSLFGLKPATAYQVKIESAGAVVAHGEFTTWSDEVPVARTINLSTLSPDGGPVLLDVNGSPDGWIRYVADKDFAIKGGEIDEEAVLIEHGRYIILDGVTISGGRRHGVRIVNSEHIRIRNCDISGYGRVGQQDFARKGAYYMPGDAKPINWDAGVYLDLVSNVTVENCFIHDPRGRANSWFYSHPTGPNAIFVRAKKGGLVIRNNDLVGSELHRWNDVIEGYGNSNVDGGFNQDSDIYGNYLAYANDDGIELDGGQCNVRFYGNKIEGGLCGISVAPNLRGPTYIFNNLVVNLGDERGAASAAVKAGGGNTNSIGTSYFYHNTFFTLGRGLTGVGFGSDKNRAMFRGHSQDNLFVTGGPGISDPNREPQNTYDGDVFGSPFGGVGDYDVAGEPVEGAGRRVEVVFEDAARGRLVPLAPSGGSGLKPVPGLEFLDQGRVGVIAGDAMPMRAAAGDLDARQVILIDRPGAPAAPVSLHVSAPQAGGGRFSILKTDTMDWLDVHAASDVVPAGGDVLLDLKFRPDSHRGAGLLMGAMIVKFEDGSSIPVTVYGVASTQRYERIFEAEQLSGASQFAAKSDPDASGGAAITLVDAAAGRSGNGKKWLEVSVEAKTAGAFYVNFRVRCPKPFELHDSIYVAINDGDPQLCSLIGGAGWQWVGLSGKSMQLNLPAGVTKIRIIPREEVDIDAVRVSDAPLFSGDRVVVAPAAG